MLRSLIAFFIIVLLLAGCEKSSETASTGGVVVSGEAQIGGAYTLTNQDGQIVTEASFLGKPQLIYFGFTFCPDVCPMALQQMSYALEQVDPKGTYFQPIFISVDPERDTPETLKQYVTADVFPKGLIGLTGTAQQIEDVKLAYKMYSAKVDDAESSVGYTIDHASLVFLMDKNGKFADVFTHSTTAEDMIKRLKSYKKRN